VDCTRPGSGCWSPRAVTPPANRSVPTCSLSPRVLPWCLDLRGLYEEERLPGLRADLAPRGRATRQSGL
jgi:hypothetical protein